MEDEVTEGVVAKNSLPTCAAHAKMVSLHIKNSIAWFASETPKRTHNSAIKMGGSMRVEPAENEVWLSRLGKHWPAGQPIQLHLQGSSVASGTKTKRLL